MSERLQPPHNEQESDPDAEDTAYDEQRQRKLDDEIERDMMRAQAQTMAVKSAAALLGVSGETAMASLRVLYQLGYMDGVLQASREVLL